MIEINSIKFEPLPGVLYRNKYVDIATDIGEGRVRRKQGLEGSDRPIDELSLYRSLILTDLWFLLYFGMGYEVANHPFWVNSCREVEDGPKDFTLDIWAREHGK